MLESDRAGRDELRIDLTPWARFGAASITTGVIGAAALGGVTAQRRAVRRYRESFAADPQGYDTLAADGPIRFSVTTAWCCTWRRSARRTRLSPSCSGTAGRCARAPGTTSESAWPAPDSAARVQERKPGWSSTINGRMASPRGAGWTTSAWPIWPEIWPQSWQPRLRRNRWCSSDTRWAEWP